MELKNKAVDEGKEMLVGGIETTKEKIPTQVIYKTKTEYRDSLVYKEIPIETIKEVVKTPRWAWSSLILNFILIALMGLWVYVKFYLKR